MNPQIIIMSAVAAVSIVFIGFLAYRNRCRSSDPNFLSCLEDDSSLEEDLKDILAFVPLEDVQQILERYMKYDGQIGDTVSFINDQKRFILRQLHGMPQVSWWIDFLRQNNLNIDNWEEKIRIFWKTSPKFIRHDPNIANGGFTVMINNILKTIPIEELHELLRQKIKYSGSFRRFIQKLRSKEFGELCSAIEENDVLHHHFFWAKESGLEITFAIELLKNLHIYLTQTLVSQ